MSMETRPALSHLAVVKSDDPADNYPRRTRAIYVGTGGSVVVVMDGQSETYANVPSGGLLRVQADRIATASTASDMVAQW